jgi:hypothetical protein
MAANPRGNHANLEGQGSLVRVDTSMLMHTQAIKAENWLWTPAEILRTWGTSYNAVSVHSNADCGMAWRQLDQACSKLAPTTRGSAARSLFIYRCGGFHVDSISGDFRDLGITRPKAYCTTGNTNAQCISLHKLSNR